MTSRGETIRRFYDAFAARDGETMASCYAPDATFEDPVFEVAGGDVGDMWRMLTSRREGELRIEYRVVDDTHAEWAADYVFGGRPVHNEVRSEFVFDDEARITKQVDTFDFRRWAGQALGWKGKVLGLVGSGLQAAVRRTSAETLTRWQQRRGQAIPPPA